MKPWSRLRMLLVAPALVFGFAITCLQASVTIQDPGQQGNDKQKKDSDQKKQNPQPGQQQPQGQQQNQPAPLFEGKSNLKSSRQTKDTATAGFNGIGPNGEVDKKMLESSANGDDQAKADRLASIHIKRSEVDEFVAQGGLKSGGK